MSSYSLGVGVADESGPESQDRTEAFKKKGKTRFGLTPLGEVVVGPFNLGVMVAIERTIMRNELTDDAVVRSFLAVTVRIPEGSDDWGESRWRALRWRRYPLLMCGRYTFTLSASSLSEAFGLVPPGFAIRDGYNIAPGQYIVIVRPEGGRRLADVAFWGLIPSWVEDPNVARKHFNARAETLADLPTFRSAFRRKRVIIPASGFYEWQEQESGKQPFYIYPAEGGFFAFAGLMEDWQGPNGEQMISACIITTEANQLLARIHNKKPRMPAILPKASWALWLDPASQIREVQPLLVPFPDALMAAHPVGQAVGNVRNDSPDLILPVA